MTETATVATTATPAAPAAAAATTTAPAATAAASTTAATTTTVATPSGAPAAAATPAAAAGTSILDGATGTTPAALPAAASPGAAPTPEALAAARALLDSHARAADPNGKNPDGTQASWLLAEGVMGQGEKPVWLKTDKYVSVAEQAKAYVELEKRFGGFTGAPKDGAYALPNPETDGFKIDNADHPVFQEFNKLAAELQMSQPTYNKVLGLMAKFEDEQVKNHEAALAAAMPNVGTEKAKLGPQADARIQAVANWAKANLDNAGFEELRTATAGTHMAAVFQVLERVIAKSGGVKMPAPGNDTPTGASVSGLAEIREMQAKKNAAGQRLYEIDPAYRQTVQKALEAHFAANPVQRDRMGHIRG